MMETIPNNGKSTPELRLNLRELAQHERTIEGEFAVTDLPRLASELMGSSAAVGDRRVHWRLRGFMRTQAGAPADAMVELHVQADLPMQCQRCLQSSMQKVQDTAVFRLVAQEPELTVEELESEEEPLCVSGPVDIAALVEDQLILALPLVPMHDACPEPIKAEGQRSQSVNAEAGEQRESPFAVLARIQKPR